MKFLELKIPPALLFLMFVAAIKFIPLTIFAVPVGSEFLPIIIKSIIFSAIAIVVFAIISFRIAKTTVDPMSPDKASKLVDSGIFRISRNPMYLGFVLMIFAGAVYKQTLFAYLLVIVFVRYLHYFQILPEERMLTKVFGQDYTEYCKRVRRWL
ncbi:methyltransferase family protein [Thalassotalea crassostreae]|uniref:methyltransferase family protein n=1 Tax=Thalassotalea crassostreae TaxID=1763536 RepID=UPI0008384752|nr:isoprenylcysteine carboxylmethyltransferase family protein [Thalassotalea crassostreae]